MIRIHVSVDGGAPRELDAAPHPHLMACLVAAGLPVDAVCGGMCSCGTCHVVPTQAVALRLGDPGDDEIALLEHEPTYVPGRSRLSCQLATDRLCDGDAFDIPT